MTIDDISLITDILSKNKTVNAKLFNYIIGALLHRDKNRNIAELRQQVADKIGYVIPDKIKKELPPTPDKRFLIGMRGNMYYLIDLNGELQFKDFSFWDVVDGNMDHILPMEVLNYIKGLVYKY